MFPSIRFFYIVLGCIFFSCTACRTSTDQNKANTATSPTVDAAMYKAPVFSDKDRETKIRAALPLADSIMKDFMQQEHLPGFAAGIVLDGKLIHTVYYGLTELSSNTRVDSLSDFRIASMTKSFTAMAILKLRDEGKLNLDDSASKYIPEMATLTYLSTDAPSITIRDLLTHRAGFPEDNPYGDRQLSDSEEDLLNMIKEGPAFSNVPGISYEYSNLGFSLLGKIIANVSGISYQQYIAEKIWKPLGMTHSYWEYSKVPSSHLAHGYRWINDKWRDEALLKDGSWGAMGGMITTIEDFSKYMAFHLSAWPPSSGPETGPIKRSSVREMHQPWNFNSLQPDFRYPSGRACPVMNSYGYGLGIMKDCYNRSLIGHGGGLPGFGSHWRIMPDHGIGIVAFSNRTYAPVSRLTLTILDTLLAITKLKPFTLPPSPILEQRKNELVKFLPDWKNAESSSIFAENFFPDYPVEFLVKESVEIFNKAGNILSVSEVRPQNQLRGFFDIQCEKAVIRVSFTLTPQHDPKIQEYHINLLSSKD